MVPAWLLSRKVYTRNKHQGEQGVIGSARIALSPQAFWKTKRKEEKDAKENQTVILDVAELVIKLPCFPEEGTQVKI